MKPIVWLHEECLAPDGPALSASVGAPAVFVFDLASLRRERYSLKRITFLYECLLELPCVIRKGDTVEEVSAFAQQHHADVILTTPPVAPWLGAVVSALRERQRVELLSVPSLIAHPGPFDLARFSRFWRKAEKYAWGD